MTIPCFSRPALLVIALLMPLILSGVESGQTGFRALEPPAKLRFTVPTPAYSTDDPAARLGDFQPGVEVDVVEALPDLDRWKVRFRRFGQPPVEALIPIPNVAVERAAAVARIQPLLDGFPLLHSILSHHEQPWSDSVAKMAGQFVPAANVLQAGTSDRPERLTLPSPRQSIWGFTPMEIAIDGSAPMPPRIIIELWNKGEAYRSSVNQSRAWQTLRTNLRDIERAFDQRPVGADRRIQVSPTIGAIRDEAELYFFPNDTIALLRNLSGEYLLLELHSYSNGALSLPPYDPATFAATLRERVETHPDGYRYISGIPMITQGDKGYCVSATLARILNYYGQPADMHALARLANTETQLIQAFSGGTDYRDVISAMRRVCATTPFQLRQLRNARKETVTDVIERGMPIFWLVPGHARLIIGIHPDTSEIVYSDSWGPFHAFKTMTWEDFFNINREMWILEPKS